MPDIAMCPGDGCTKKQRCYRYRAIPTPRRQTYFATPPVKENGDCPEFLELRPNDRLAEVK